MTSFEPISVAAAGKYLDAMRAWHIAQGWPPPLSDANRERIHWSLRGLENLQARRRSRPPRPPVLLHMLGQLRDTVNLENSFEACIWAIAACAFWGLMRFGEVTVHSRAAFTPSLHLTRVNALFGTDLNGKEYARLDLPSAKTAWAGETQHLFLCKQNSLCPLDALQNLTSVVPAGPSDPLFSWRDQRGCARPMVRDTELKFINSKFTERGFGVNPEIVRLMGRWRSLAYEVYIRAFEQVALHHTAHLAANYGY